MSPPMPASPIAIGIWTDEALILSLEKIMHGSPLPINVIADVNPYKYLPSDLPDGICYFISSKDKKDTQIGFWKAKGEACEIFTNSTITGWRRTLEFYEGQAPHGHRTDWVMQEYRITRKGLFNNSKIEDSGSLCRVFHSDEQIPDIASRSQLTLSSLPNADITIGQGSKKDMSGNDGMGPSAMTERLQDPLVENLDDFNYLLSGDYLELDDLADPQSPSSSSDNSSCLTVSSDEYFDSLALLRELENENEDHKDRQIASFKYSVSASVEPTEIIVFPTTLGNISSEGTQKAEEVASSSQNAAASSSRHKAVKEKKKKDVSGRMKKLKKKYFCLMPF